VGPAITQARVCEVSKFNSAGNFKGT